jgi:hypothetical protein
MEWRKTGILECWKNGIMGPSLKSFNHVSHHSIIPVFHHSNAFYIPAFQFICSAVDFSLYIFSLKSYAEVTIISI